MVKKRYNSFGKYYFTTKEFFRQYKIGQKDSFIEKLKKHQNENQQTNETTNDPEEILKIAKGFYSDLYRKERPDPLKQEYFLSFIEKKIFDQDNIALNRHLQEAETENAIKKTKKGGSPGIDGLKIDWYQEFKTELLTPLTHVLNHYFETSKVPYESKLSVLSLIHKKKERDLIPNYRPISLSNNDVKILSKIMVERLKPLTDRLISPTQFACPGRSISSAVNILRDIFWDSHQNQRENFVISVFV